MTDLGCKSCHKACLRFENLDKSGTVTHEHALAAYEFGRSCRYHNGRPCVAGAMLADYAYTWLYAQVSMA